MKRYTPTQLKEFIKNEIDGINEDIGFEKYKYGHNGYGIGIFPKNQTNLVRSEDYFESHYNEKSKSELWKFLESLRLFRNGIEIGMNLQGVK